MRLALYGEFLAISNKASGVTGWWHRFPGSFLHAFLSHGYWEKKLRCGHARIRVFAPAIGGAPIRARTARRGLMGAGSWLALVIRSRNSTINN
jgi:hypothetical protein